MSGNTQSQAAAHYHDGSPRIHHCPSPGLAQPSPVRVRGCCRWLVGSFGAAVDEGGGGYGREKGSVRVDGRDGARRSRKRVRERGVIEQAEA